MKTVWASLIATAASSIQTTGESETMFDDVRAAIQELIRDHTLLIHISHASQPSTQILLHHLGTGSSHTTFRRELESAGLRACYCSPKINIIYLCGCKCREIAYLCHFFELR